MQDLNTTVQTFFDQADEFIAKVKAHQAKLKPLTACPICGADPMTADCNGGACEPVE